MGRALAPLGAAAPVVSAPEVARTAERAGFAGAPRRRWENQLVHSAIQLVGYEPCDVAVSGLAFASGMVNSEDERAKTTIAEIRRIGARGMVSTSSYLHGAYHMYLREKNKCDR
jgi:hypothetical protein